MSLCCTGSTKKKGRSSTSSRKKESERKDASDKQNSEKNEDFCQHLMDHYITPTFKPLFIEMVEPTSSVPDKENSYSNVTLKTGKEIVLEQVYSKLLQQFKLCSQVHNHENSVSTDEFKTYPSELLKSFQSHLISTKRNERWNLLETFSKFRNLIVEINAKRKPKSQREPSEKLSTRDGNPFPPFTQNKDEKEEVNIQNQKIRTESKPSSSMSMPPEIIRRSEKVKSSRRRKPSFEKSRCVGRIASGSKVAVPAVVEKPKSKKEIKSNWDDYESIKPAENEGNWGHYETATAPPPSEYKTVDISG